MGLLSARFRPLGRSVLSRFRVGAFFVVLLAFLIVDMRLLFRLPA